MRLPWGLTQNPREGERIRRTGFAVPKIARHGGTGAGADCGICGQRTGCEKELGRIAGSGDSLPRQLGQVEAEEHQDSHHHRHGDAQARLKNGPR